MWFLLKITLKYNQTETENIMESYLVQENRPNLINEMSLQVSHAVVVNVSKWRKTAKNSLQGTSRSFLALK